MQVMKSNTKDPDLLKRNDNYLSLAHLIVVYKGAENSGDNRTKDYCLEEYKKATKKMDESEKNQQKQSKTDDFSK
jgi:hypothetical protein